MPRSPKPIDAVRAAQDEQYWLAFEAATKFTNPALILPPAVEQLIGIHRDCLPALEASGIIRPAGKRIVGGVKKYSLKEVVLLRNNPALLEKAVEAAQAWVSQKNATKARQREKDVSVGNGS